MLGDFLCRCTAGEDAGDRAKAQTYDRQAKFAIVEVVLATKDHFRCLNTSTVSCRRGRRTAIAKIQWGRGASSARLEWKKRLACVAPYPYPGPTAGADYHLLAQPLYLALEKDLEMRLVHKEDRYQLHGPRGCGHQPEGPASSSSWCQKDADNEPD